MLVQKVFFLNYETVFLMMIFHLLYICSNFSPEGKFSTLKIFLWFNKMNISFRRSGILLLHAQNTSSSRGGSVTKLPLGTHCGKCGNLSRFFLIYIYMVYGFLRQLFLFSDGDIWILPDCSRLPQRVRHVCGHTVPVFL